MTTHLEAMLDIILGNEKSDRSSLGVGILKIVIPGEVGLPLPCWGLQLDVLLLREAGREDERRRGVVAEPVRPALISLITVDPIERSGSGSGSGSGRRGSDE